MKDEQLLKKVIEKAVKGGWNTNQIDISDYGYTFRTEYGEITYHFHSLVADKEYFRIIFSNDFAKAYWGENKVCDLHGKRSPCCEDWTIPVYIIAWHYHQHKMLDEIQAGKNSLKYLEKFL